MYYGICRVCGLVDWLYKRWSTEKQMKVLMCKTCINEKR